MTSQSAARSPKIRRRWVAVGLVLAAIVWVFVNGRVPEGRVLLVITASHGVTLADLPSIVAIIVAALLFLSSLRARKMN
jgi:hypothetical protein